MSIKSSNSYADIAKWLALASLLAVGVFANYYYAHISLAFRLLGGLLIAGIALFIGLQTSKGKQLLAFAREAKIEMHKVVWPTRPETLQTSLIVIVIVALMALLLWGMDSLFLWLISLLR